MHNFDFNSTLFLAIPWYLKARNKYRFISNSLPQIGIARPTLGLLHEMPIIIEDSHFFRMRPLFFVL